MPAATGTGDRRNLLDHPRGLWIITATELWDRISFHGMQALLTEMRDKPRPSGWGRIARTAKPSSGKIQLPEGLRQGMPDVKPVERALPGVD